MLFPKFIEKYVDIHWKRIFCNFTKKENIGENWKQTTSIDNFIFCLPYLNNKGKWETNTLEVFFILIRKGCIPSETLLGPEHPDDSDVEIAEALAETTKKEKIC